MNSVGELEKLGDAVDVFAPKSLLHGAREQLVDARRYGTSEVQVAGSIQDVAEIFCGQLDREHRLENTRSDLLSVVLERRAGNRCGADELCRSGVRDANSWLADPDLQAGRLVRLLPDYEPSAAPIRALTPPGRHLNKPVRALIDELRATLRATLSPQP